MIEIEREREKEQTVIGKRGRDREERRRKSWASFIRLFSLPEMAEFNPELGLASSPQITP